MQQHAQMRGGGDKAAHVRVLPMMSAAYFLGLTVMSCITDKQHE